MPKSSNSGELGHNFYDISLNGLDDTVTPAILAYGTMGKDGSGSWHYTLVSADGANLARSDDASKFRVSALGVTVTTSPLSADSSSVSAKQGDAGNLHVSAFSNDAGLLRVSTIGGTASSNDILVDGLDNTISASLLRVSGTVSAGQNGLVVYAQNRDNATNLRASAAIFNSLSATAQNFVVSAVAGDAGTFRVSALNQDANFMHVSGFSPDASLFRISVTNFPLNVSGTLSAFINQGTISAYSPDASLFRISAFDIDTPTSAGFTAAGNSLTMSSIGYGFIGGQLSGTWSGTVAFQATNDGSNWFPTWGLDNNTQAIVSSTTTSRNMVWDIGGWRQFRLSATAWSSGTLSANLNATLGSDNLTVAIKQDDAGNARLSALSQDGSLMRVSAISLTATNLPVSATQADAGLLHVSAIGTLIVSAHEVKQSDASALLVSAKSGDANQLHVSAVQGDAGLAHISAFVDSGSVSAKSGDGNQFHVSAVQGDSGLLRVSAILQAGVSSSGAANFGVSASQIDAGALHVSADLFADTTGALTVFQTLSVSASQSVKGSAGALYGYYLYNTDTKPNYIKLYNVSAAANIGTDTPIMTICLPASAAANVEFPHGLAGFTAGINITATSGRPLDNTAAPAASSVGALLFYK